MCLCQLLESSLGKRSARSWLGSSQHSAVFEEADAENVRRVTFLKMSGKKQIWSLFLLTNFLCVCVCVYIWARVETKGTGKRMVEKNNLKTKGIGFLVFAFLFKVACFLLVFFGTVFIWDTAFVFSDDLCVWLFSDGEEDVQEDKDLCRALQWFNDLAGIRTWLSFCLLLLLRLHPIVSNLPGQRVLKWGIKA